MEMIHSMAAWWAIYIRFGRYQMGGDSVPCQCLPNDLSTLGNGPRVGKDLEGK